MYLLIHPDFTAAPVEPAGAPAIKWSWYLALGRINSGKIVFPAALIVQMRVTSSPRSAEVTEPTCFCSFSHNTFRGTCTVVIPVSSKL